MIYLKDGNMPLNLAYDDDIVQEANSTYQLSFKFPLTDGKWNLLKREVFLLADDLHGEQEFFIFEVKKANSYVQVYAKQVATLLNYYSINSISVDRVPGQTAMTALAGSIKRNCPFTFFSDIMDRHTFNESNVSVMDALAKDKHSIVGQWGGDLVRDKYQVKLLKNGGIENESLFMYKKNLSSYEESENINNLKTRLHLKKTIQGQSEGEKDRVIAVTVDSPLIGQYRQIYEADIEVNDQDVMDEATLTAYGQRYFSSTLCDLVENSINLDVKGKSDVSVKLFDTVSVFHERFDVDLRLKITSYHFGPMSKRLKSIGFGKVSQSVKSTVASMVVGSVDKATERLSASFEQKLQKEIDNANRHFDAEFEKRVEEINDGIEQSKAEAERYADAIKQEIATEINDLDTAMQSQAQEHDRQVADILSKTQSVESLANQAKSDAASALARANQVKTEAIADARAQVSTVSQALNTAKTELQTAIAGADQKARDSQASATALRNDLNLQASKILEQARAQTALASRVTTVETLADGTRSTVTELSKTVSKATGDIASVTSRTKTVEDTLSQTRTQYEALTQTVNTQTGQIESINQKTADLQSGIDGVTERFESLQIGGRNYFRGYNHNEEIVLPTYNGVGSFIQIYDKLTFPLLEADGKIFTISFEAISPNGDTVLQVYNANGNPQYFYFSPTTVGTATNAWKKFKATVIPTTRTTYTSSTESNRLEIYAPSKTGVKVRNIKVELGTIPTDWSPAEEDLHSEIAEYKRTVEESSAELSRQIQLADGKAVEAKSYAQQTATAIDTRLESLETYKDGEGTRASQYLSASQTETAKQIAAERAAIANDYVAKSTYTEDVRGTTQRLNEIKSTADTANQNLATYQNTVDRKLEELTSSTQTMDGKINTASSKVDSVAGEIRTELTRVEGKIPTKVGGRNYILNSRTVSVLSNSTQTCPISTEQLKEGSREFVRIRRLNPSLNPSLISLYTAITGFSSEMPTSGEGKISFKARASSPVNMNVMSILISSTSTNLPWDKSQISIGPEWKTYSFDFEFIKGMTILRANPFQILPPVPNLAEFYLDLCEWQLEAGTMASSWSPAPEDLATVTALHSVRDTVDSHTRTISTINGTVSTLVQTAAGLVQEVSGTNGLKTQVSTLAGSYAIKNLTTAGDVLGQINLNKDGSVKIDGSLVQITGKTYIQDGVIKEAMIGDLSAGKITSGTLDAARIKANSIDGSKIAFDEAFFNGLTANEAYLEKLFAKNAFITSVQAVTLSASQITSGSLKASNNNMAIHLDEAEIEFKNNAKIRFLSSDNSISRTTPGLPKQFLKFETGQFVQYEKTKLASRLVLGSNSDNVENAETDRFSGQRWWQARDGASMGELVANQVLIYSNGTHRGPLVFNTGGSVKSIHPTAGSSWDIGLNEAKFRYMHVYDIYLQNGTRLGQALKDLANRVGHNGWADNLS